MYDAVLTAGLRREAPTRSVAIAGGAMRIDYYGGVCMHAEAAQLRLSSTFMSLRTTNRASGVSAPMASCHQVRVCLQRQRAAGVSLVQTRSTVCLLVSNVLLLRVGTTEPQIGPTLGCQGHCFFGVHPVVRSGFRGQSPPSSVRIFENHCFRAKGALAHRSVQLGPEFLRQHFWKRQTRYVQ